MLILIVGNIGSGKTLLLTILLNYAFHKLGKTIGFFFRSNYKTTFTEIINVNDIINFELENCVLGLDELGTLIDSRTNTQSQRFIDYFITQSRKRNVDIIGTTQLTSMIDLRFRDLVQVLFLAEKLDKCFRFTKYEGYIQKGHFDLSFEKAKPFYKMYDTNEIIYPIDLFSGRTVSFEKLLEIYDNAPTKKAFVQSAKREYPYISLENLNASYDYLKKEQIKDVKKLLGVKDADN